MHIMEGYLPVAHAAGWWAAALPFMVAGVRSLQRLVTGKPSVRMLVGAAAAFVFVLSALKLPSVTGSSSHPTGTGLGAILFGPGIMSILGTVVLLFQALLLAHGGVTTLGANAFSMAIVGPWACYAVYRGLRRFGTTKAVFMGAAVGNLMTYAMTSGQLALAFPDAQSGMAGALFKFLTIFGVTQIPLALAEGILTVLVFNALTAYSTDELKELNVLGGTLPCEI